MSKNTLFYHWETLILVTHLSHSSWPKEKAIDVKKECDSCQKKINTLFFLCFHYLSPHAIRVTTTDLKVDLPFTLQKNNVVFYKCKIVFYKLKNIYFTSYSGIKEYQACYVDFLRWYRIYIICQSLTECKRINRFVRNRLRKGLINYKRMDELLNSLKG